MDRQNCYGIKKLQKEFDFKNTPVYALYAPNGAMKSSLAQTFQDAASGKASEDRIFPDRVTTRKITDEAGQEISGERILVVLPYDPEFGPTEKTSTLLVDAKLRMEHEQLQLRIHRARDALLSAVKQQSGSKRNLEHEISSAITRSDNKFEDAVVWVQKEIQKQKDTALADVKYDIIFNDKSKRALESAELKDAMEEYILRYNELLGTSTYFKKGTFDYYNAGQIAKSLADNGFFSAQQDSVNSVPSKLNRNDDGRGRA